MTRFLLRRLLGFFPTMLGILTVSFVIVHSAPGEPFIGEKAISAEAREELRKRYHLDEPLPMQFAIYVRNMATGDFGMSSKYPGRSVAEMIRNSFPATFTIGIIAFFWALLVGITAGVIGAMRQNTFWDHATMGFALIGISMPSFVLGPLLALFFALTLYWLPPAGWGSWQHVVLPALTLGTVSAAAVARLTRTGVLEVIRQDFVRTAHAKGLPERIVIWRHVLRAGLLPVVSYLGPLAAILFTGTVVIENVFNVPGTGSYLVDAARNNDYNLALGMVIFFGAFLLIANLVVDLAYAWIDPRIRYE